MHVLRDDPAFIPELDYVMEQGGKLIGQNMFMKTVINADDGRDEKSRRCDEIQSCRISCETHPSRVVTIKMLSLN